MMLLIDIMNTRFVNDKVDYVRIKTRLKTEAEQHCLLPITEPAKIIIDRWIDNKTKKLDFGYKFSYHNFSRYACRSLATLAKDLGIKEKVVFYSARKSFAQYAFDFPKEFQLFHKMFPLLFRYFIQKLPIILMILHKSTKINE